MTRLSSDEFNNPSVLIDQALEDIDSENSYKRADAIKRIGQLNLSIQDIPMSLHSKLEKALNDPEPPVRKEAAMTLAFLEGDIALPLLEPLLEDPIQTVRSFTIAALSYIGKKPSIKSVNRLIDYLSDPNPEIRDRTARALGRLQIVQAKQNLLGIAESDVSPIVRAGAIVGLSLFKQKDPDLKSKFQHLLRVEKSSIVIEAINEAMFSNSI